MLIVNQNQSNIIILTLSQEIESNDFFTLDLINEYTNQSYEDIIITDISEYTNRYNKFILTLTTENLVDYSSGKIFLKNDGTYVYKVYSNVDDYKILIEQGFMKVLDDEVISTISYTENDNKTFLSYEK